MKRFKRITAGVLMATMLMGLSACSRSYTIHTGSRTRSTEEADEPDDNYSDDLLRKSFGSYEVGYDWVEVPGHSAPPNYYSYCMAGDEQSSMPNNIAVSYGTNRYSLEDSDDFTGAILSQLTVQAAAYNGTAVMTAFSTDPDQPWYRFDVSSDDGARTIQWYICGDYKYVMVSLAIYDEDLAEEDHAIDVAEGIVESFNW